MSTSGIIAQNGKIFDNLLPNPYPYPAQANSLAQVLIAGDDAGNGNIENLLQLQTTNVVQQDQIGGHLTIGGTPSNPGSGGDLRIQGATLKGSILAGNGTSTVGLPVGANGLVLKANSATATGLEWGADASGGTVEAVNAGTNISVGGTISQPIVNLSAPLTSTLGMGTVALTDKVGASGSAGQFLSAGTGGETEWATPPDTLPNLTAGNNIDITGTSPNLTIALQSPLTSTLDVGSQQINGAGGFNTLNINSGGDLYNCISGIVDSKNRTIAGVLQAETLTQFEETGNSNAVISSVASNLSCTTSLTSTNVSNPCSSSVGMTTLSAFPNPQASVGVSASVPNPAPDPDTIGSIALQTNQTSPSLSLTQTDPLALITSYSTTLDKDGIIQNNSGGTGFNLQSAQNIALTAPSANVINITNGNNIELLDPTATGYTTTISKQGIDTNYSVGGVVNQEDIAVSATSVQNTISTTNTTDNINSAVLTCDTNFVNNVMLSQVITSGSEKSAGVSLTCNTSSTNPNAQIGCGVSVPTSIPFPDITANVSIGCPDASTPQIIIAQSAPFLPTYSTIIDKDGINQNNSSGSGLTITSNSLNCSINSGATIGIAGQFITLAGSGAGGVQLSAPAGTITSTSSTGQQVVVSTLNNVSTPTLTITNSNASIASYPVIKTDRPTPVSVAGDVIGAISTWADDGAGTSREWSRIQTKTENVGVGNQDATFSIFTSVNGTLSEVANYNGAQNENNTFRPFDLNNNDIRTTSGNIVLSGTLSSGVGSIELKSKDATAGAGTGLILTGNTLLSGSAGGNSGQHLALTINGTVYKIALLNP
jgi:hypothetical protein